MDTNKHEPGIHCRENAQKTQRGKAATKGNAMHCKKARRGGANFAGADLQLSTISDNCLRIWLIGRDFRFRKEWELFNREPANHAIRLRSEASARQDGGRIFSRAHSQSVTISHNSLRMWLITNAPLPTEQNQPKWVRLAKTTFQLRFPRHPQL
jgi:hypothetical protein